MGAQSAAIAISSIALIVAVVSAWVQFRQSRNANSVPVLVDMFAEHRALGLVEARRYVQLELKGKAMASGFEGVEAEWRERVKALMGFYDNLGVLVAHDIVDVDAVAGYLGGSVLSTWSVLAPLVEAERSQRTFESDRGRYQEYFENLALLLQSRADPNTARRRARLWVKE